MTESENDGRESTDNPANQLDGSWTQVAQRYYDPDRDAELATVIVVTVAEAEGVAPTELKVPLLYECVDAPALEDAFFGRDGGASRRGGGTVEFRYDDYRVTVRSDGRVQVYERADADRR